MTMQISETSICGVTELVTHRFSDHRGSFHNAYRSQDPRFQQYWGEREVAQVNISRTSKIGTVRGMHMQAPPHQEAKLIRCLKGKVFDVAVDLRPSSSSYGQWHAIELSAQAGNAILIPEGCAHGFQVLEENSELLYLHSGAWVPEAETGVRFNDPELAIQWPLEATDVSERDCTLPYFR